jgi:RNA polymerase sigma-70 factor (ECF subfamily)
MDKQSLFNSLYESHFDKVSRLCRGYFAGDEAESLDAAQEVFIKIWEHLESFRGESSIGTWIYRIAVNTCLLHLRKQSSKKRKMLPELPLMDTDASMQEEGERLQKMYQCINRLSATDKVITLMMLEGIGYSEISSIVGINEDTLRVRIHRIKKSLTECVHHGNV